MDGERCTAVAFEEFGHRSSDSMHVSASGGLYLSRGFVPRQREESPRKSMRFWLHFVPMPVQVGAVTSPQSMLAPLKVTVEPAGNR
jgi:hypothetical protein